MKVGLQYCSNLRFTADDPLSSTIRDSFWFLRLGLVLELLKSIYLVVLSDIFNDMMQRGGFSRETRKRCLLTLHWMSQVIQYHVIKVFGGSWS